MRIALLALTLWTATAVYIVDSSTLNTVLCAADGVLHTIAGYLW